MAEEDFLANVYELGGSCVVTIDHKVVRKLKIINGDEVRIKIKKT